MSEQRYVFDRGYPFVDPISAERARELYERAAARPDAELEGSLEEGFSYVVARSGEMRIVRCRVRRWREGDPTR